MQSGSIDILGFDVARQAAEVRRRIGVVFQAPSLDKKLTVRENLRQQGHLYGLSGETLQKRQREMLERLGLTRSGGRSGRDALRRAAAPRRTGQGDAAPPRLLLLDEPSTGLDPGARSDLWDYLREIRAADGVTVVLTTHLLEEADKADRMAILHQGELVALDTPDRLRATVGGDTITIESDDPAGLAAAIGERFGSQRVGRRRRRAAGAARRTPVGRPAGRGVPRPRAVDHVGQADAGRRVHRAAPGIASGTSARR